MKTVNVNNVVTSKAEVDKLLPEKYFEASYQGPWSLLTRYSA